MPTLNVTVEGLDKLLAKASASSLLYPPMRTFFEQATLAVRREVFVRTPRRTGNLQAHLTHEIDKSPLPHWAAVGFLPLDIPTSHGRIPLAQLMEFGTGIYSDWPGANRQPIQPVTKHALAFQVDGQTIVRHSVDGVKPHMMLREGWIAALPKVLGLIQAASRDIEARWKR